MQEEVTNKTITLCIRTAKFGYDVFRNSVNEYMHSQQQKSNNRRALRQQEKLANKAAPREGKITVKELAKQNAGMTNIEITNKNIKRFERYARKYGVNYALKKDKTKEPPVYLVFFKARDQDAINSAFREFLHNDLKRANKPSIRKKLVKYVALVKQNKKDRVKNKHQEQVR